MGLSNLVLWPGVYHHVEHASVCGKKAHLGGTTSRDRLITTWPEHPLESR